MFFFFDFDNKDKIMEVEELRGNKGEWSEPYVLFRLLADGRIYAADENLKKLSSIYFPILKIFRQERKDKNNRNLNNINFSIDKDKKVEVYFNETLLKTVSQSDFEKEADYLLDQIKTSSETTFNVRRSQSFLNGFNCYYLKALNENKADITIQIHDINTGYDPICGFSIKSQLGNASTLINADKSTNFIFEIQNLSEEQIKKINEIETSRKIVDRMNFIKQNNGDLVFTKMKHSVYEENLYFIDSCMPELLSWALKYSYLENLTSCKDIVNLLQNRNPLHFPNNKKYYEYKFKKFLCSAALGMMPATEWDGKDEANGGYIIVKDDGEVLAYHIYNRDKFEEYLLNNTKFERGSTSRHEFATVYKENEKYFINLNLQIRFIK